MVYLMAAQPSPAFVESNVALALPPVPAPFRHCAFVEVDGEDAIVLIAPPGCSPSPAFVMPLLNNEMQLDPPAPPCTQ